MAITVTSKPQSGGAITSSTVTHPVPVSDCWRWCLQAASGDAVTTPGSSATVTVIFPGTCTVPANGTALKIWGYDFTVNNAADYTGTTFKVVSSGLLTALNFANMITANLFFNDAVTVAATAVSTTWKVVLTWRECREQPRFVSEQMVFTAITATGGSGTYVNGVSPVYVDGFKIVTRLGYYTDATIVFNPISPKVGLTTDNQCTTVGPVCVDYVEDAQAMLFTRLPELSATSFTTSIENGRSLMRFFSLEYGWAYRANCQARSGTIMKSDVVLGINAAFDIEDEYQMRRYWFAHPEGYPTGQSVSDFLTTQPKKTKLCWESFAWLWLLNSWQTEYGSSYNLWARFVLYGTAGTIIETFDYMVNNSASDGIAFYQAVNFNVSPAFVLAHAPTLTSATLTRYDVQVIGKNAGGTVLFNATEYLAYEVGHCCEGNTDLYVLTPAGGFATQLIEIQERSVVKDGQEVNLQVPCGNSRSDRAKYGGRTMVSLRTYEKINFVFRIQNTPEGVRWAKHVRQSPQTMLRAKGEGVYSIGPTATGTPLARKFIIDPSTVSIYVNGEGIDFKATGYLGDIPTQKGIEP